MRFHVVNLPHTQVTPEYVHCAYTQKTRKFCDMMSSLGHEVYLYASEENEAKVTELVTVISKEKQQEFFGDNDHTKTFFNITWDPGDRHWQYMNTNAIKEIKKRIQPKDFICLIGGSCQQQIAEAFPGNFSVEYGIGYTGTFSKYRVFESYAHMHYVHGDQHDDNGSFYDTVIPNYYDPKEFPFSQDKGDYYLFIGRLIERKGYHIAQEVCQKLGKRLIVAGQTDHEFTGYGEYIGTVNTEERGKLMSNAIATFVPSIYLEPFGGVHAESLLSGTPVITTNFGVYTSTVINSFNGYRCDTFGEFVEAAKRVAEWDKYKRISIRTNAIENFGMENVARKYEAYFERLLELYNDGWYSDKHWLDIERTAI